MRLNEARRPGITELARRIARSKPHLSSDAVLAEAKQRYTNRTIAVKRGGQWIEEPNPDYLAGRGR